LFGVKKAELIKFSMPLHLQGSEPVEFSCKEDLLKAVPEGSTGKPLNYGQGEGQVEIDETVWGFYINENDEYLMQFEEGKLDWRSLNNLVELLVARINDSFGVDIKIEVEGPFTNQTGV